MLCWFFIEMFLVLRCVMMLVMMVCGGLWLVFWGSWRY